MKSQQGMVLVFSLMVLLVLTLLSVSAMNEAFIGERVARHELNHKLALVAAETTIIEAETIITAMDWHKDLAPKLNIAAGYYEQGQLLEAELFNRQHWHAGDNCVASEVLNTPSSPSGCYKVQHIDYQTPLQIGGYDNPSPATIINQITARGLDGNASSSAIVQSYYLSQVAQ